MAYKRKTAANPQLAAPNRGKPREKIIKKSKSKQCAPSDDETLLNDDDLKEVDRRHMKHRASYSEDHEDIAAANDKTHDDEWGVDFASCRPKVFACVHSLYEESFGLSIIRVLFLLLLRRCTSSLL